MARDATSAAMEAHRAHSHDCSGAEEPQSCANSLTPTTGYKRSLQGNRLAHHRAVFSCPRLEVLAPAFRREIEPTGLPRQIAQRNHFVGEFGELLPSGIGAIAESANRADHQHCPTGEGKHGRRRCAGFLGERLNLPAQVLQFATQFRKIARPATDLCYVALQPRKLLRGLVGVEADTKYEFLEFWHFISPRVEACDLPAPPRMHSTTLRRRRRNRSGKPRRLEHPRRFDLNRNRRPTDASHGR